MLQRAWKWWPEENRTAPSAFDNRDILIINLDFFKIK
jgi:hypothetical protein